MQPEEYLWDRICGIDQGFIANPKKPHHRGGMYLINSGFWRTRYKEWISITNNILVQSQWMLGTQGNEIKLTALSIKIGEAVAGDILGDTSNKADMLAIGNLMLESYLQTGHVKIEMVGNQTTNRDVKLKNAKPVKGKIPTKKQEPCYRVEILKPLATRATLQGTYAKCPPDIKSLRSPKGKPFIKGFTKADEPVFMELVEAKVPFIQALNRLRQQSWEINQEVLEIVRKSPSCFKKYTIDLIDKYTGEVKTFNVLDRFGKDFTGIWMHNSVDKFKKEKDEILLKLRSKIYEYDTIMRKTEVIPKVFWQEYTCDYRGRVYCSEAFLQFQGSDLARGMFLFHEKKKYNEAGIRYLKIHLGKSYNRTFKKGRMPSYFVGEYDKNLTNEKLEAISMDKLMPEDIVAWVDNNLQTLTSSTGKLHMRAENPVAFLSCCIELRNVMADPEYLGGLPIPMDGANNGWQHLAAMSKDREAATLVSMTNVEYQKDFYVAVAKEMINLRPKWFAKKKIPMKDIRKGIAKRGAMTRAYSAGEPKIATNMIQDCTQMGFTKKYGITEADCVDLAKALCDAVEAVCKGPLRVKEWLNKVLLHELEQGECDFEWTTPSGFPVRYKAYKVNQLDIRATLVGVKENNPAIDHVVNVTAIGRRTGKPIPDRDAYTRGIAPNMVHSYDASHLAFVIMRHGKCFGAVHDSFSTHACDVDDMLDIAKGTFIGMYSMDNWFDDFKTRIMKHADTFTVPNPELGDYDVTDVLDAGYFFC